MFASSSLIFIINIKDSFLVCASLRDFFIKDDFVKSVHFKVKVRCPIPEGSGKKSQNPR